MLQPVMTEQGGSTTRDNEEVELVLLVLVRNMDSNDTKDRDFRTCVCGELRRRGKEWGSIVRGPEPVVHLFAHNRQGRTCVHFHGGFGIRPDKLDLLFLISHFLNLGAGGRLLFITSLFKWP